MAVTHNLNQDQEQFLGDLIEGEYLFIREDAPQNPLYLKLSDQTINEKEKNNNYYIPNSIPKETTGKSQETIELLKIINTAFTLKNKEL